MSEIKAVKIPDPETKTYIIEMLRGLIEKAYNERILYIDIQIKTDKDKKLQSFSFGDSTDLRDK